MDSQMLFKFLNGLTLPMKYLGFDSAFTSWPSSFSSVSLDVVDLSRKNQRLDATLKDFLKRPVTVLEHETVRVTGRQAGEEQAGKVRILAEKDRDESESCSDEEINLDSQEVQDALQKLNSFFDAENLERLGKVWESFRDEKELEIGLGTHMFSKLAGNAFTAMETSKKKCPCGCNEAGLEGRENMWIGSPDTWFGELDIIAGSEGSGSRVSVLVLDSVVAEDEDDEMSDSQDDNTDGEVETDIESSGFSQAVSQSIVFGFTEHNRHKDQGCVIPSILIDKIYYYIIMYSPVSDVLVTASIKYNFGLGFGEQSEFFRAGLILWLILNHRVFFSKFPNLLNAKESGFKRKVNNLEKYKELNEYSKIIHKRSEDLFRLSESVLWLSNTPQSITYCDEIQNKVLHRPKSTKR